MSKQHSTLLPRTAPMSNEFIVKFSHLDGFSNNVADFGNNVETDWTCSVCFDFVKRIVRLVTFDKLASTLLLVWTGPTGLNITPCGLHGAWNWNAQRTIFGLGLFDCLYLTTWLWNCSEFSLTRCPVRAPGWWGAVINVLITALYKLFVIRIPIGKVWMYRLLLVF